ncbi:hypothetical protein BJ170DRAFT_696564 [Xylariales sp. AK1849]|nr:hypothetical protein BJ170DRAFT_696564 [Xylariales sp. AK1849]
MAAELQDLRMSDGCNIRVKAVEGRATGKAFEPLASYGFLADKSKFVVFDMRRSGDSDKQRPYTHKRWIEDVEEGCYHLRYTTVEMTC